MTTVHACPSGPADLTPCCARTPFELPRTDRITLDLSLVTCTGEIEMKALAGGAVVFGSDTGSIRWAPPRTAATPTRRPGGN